MQARLVLLGWTEVEGWPLEQEARGVGRSNQRAKDKTLTHLGLVVGQRGHGFHVGAVVLPVLSWFACVGTVSSAVGLYKKEKEASDAADESIIDLVALPFLPSSSS